uniref:transposase n=1 Tax=Streptomyces leeuwenhoekii TaxID=1437453 RepID=UPI000B20857D|nr:transposase [Streptomyces leeuwenhoekii]
MEWDEQAVTGWVKETWPQVEAARRRAEPFLVFEDEVGFSLTPPTCRTWARRGHTPVVRVRGRSQRRFSIAALACYRTSERSRLIYRPRRHADHKRGGRRSFTRTDYRNLLTAAHQQLKAPLVLVWDNLNVHLDHRMRDFIDTHDWITSHQLPSYAPDLNPVEGIWSVIRRSTQANTVFTDPTHLIRVLRHHLRELQYRSDVIDGCLAATGLKMTTSRPQLQ